LPNEPPGRFSVNSLKNVYLFEPHDSQLTDSQQRHILGLQADLWSEHIQTEQRLEWMALPRAAAVAEVGWSPQARSWPDFLQRLSAMSVRYRAFGLHDADSAFGISARFARDNDAISVTLSNLPELRDAALDAIIRYTLNGTEPSAASALYAEPLSAALGTEIRAATFLGSQQVSRTRVSKLAAESTARRTSTQLDLCSNAVGLLLEPPGAPAPNTQQPLAVDIMNTCWIYRDVDLGGGANLTAAVTALPFNYELGADAAKIRVGDKKTAVGEREVHTDSCDGALLAALPLPQAASADFIAQLPQQKLPALAGRHDVCLKFARPALDPMWALDWVEIKG
jgi:hexosaminidase